MVKRSIATQVHESPDSKPCPFLLTAETKDKLVKPVVISEDAIKMENKRGDFY